MFDLSKIHVPFRMALRPKDRRGLHVPFFQHIPDTFEQDRKVDFRIKNPVNQYRAIERRLCGLCGQEILRTAFCYFIGTEQDVKHRVFADPPMHLSCAQYAMQVCPFLSNPNYIVGSHDIEKTVPEANRTQGKRPDHMALYKTRTYCRALAHNGSGVYVQAGDPIEIVWFRGDE